MGTVLLRISDRAHAYIMESAKARGISGTALMDAWVARDQGESGDTKHHHAADVNAPKRKYMEPLYALKKEFMAEIVSPVPVCRKTAVKPLECSLMDTLKPDPNLPAAQYDAWLMPSHSLTFSIGWISGRMTRHIRSEIAPDFSRIEGRAIDIREESHGVFLPLNENAKTILFIVGANSEERKPRHYFTTADIYILWVAGWDISYDGMQVK